MTWLTPAEVARVWNVKPSTVRTWLQRGHAVRNDQGLIDSEQLLEWWDKRRNPQMDRRT